MLVQFSAGFHSLFACMNVTTGTSKKSENSSVSCLRQKSLPLQSMCPWMSIIHCSTRYLALNDSMIYQRPVVDINTPSRKQDHSLIHPTNNFCVKCWQSPGDTLMSTTDRARASWSSQAEKAYLPNYGEVLSIQLTAVVLKRKSPVTRQTLSADFKLYIFKMLNTDR